MVLAGMMATDRDALICDLAETYGILDYRALSTEMLATLCVGLRENSRIKMKFNGMQTSSEILLLMSAVDYLKLLVWMNTEDGANNVNRPRSMVAELFGEPSTEVEAFDSGEDFEVQRSIIMKEV